MSSSLPKVLLIKFYQLQKNIMTTHRVPTVFSQELHQFYIDSLQVLVVICIGITSFRGYIQQAYMCPGSLAITFRNRSSYNQSISSPPPPPIQDTQHYQATVISSRSSNTKSNINLPLKGKNVIHRNYKKQHGKSISRKTSQYNQLGTLNSPRNITIRHPFDSPCSPPDNECSNALRYCRMRAQ